MAKLHYLCPGMEYRRLSNQEATDLAGRILYEDNHLLIVNKRAGELAQGDVTGDECLAETYKAFIAMRDHKPGKVYMGIPHRLDRPVSGAIILAKTSKGLERMARMFRDGSVHKTYWALCHETPPQAQGDLKDWLIRNGKTNKSHVSPREADGAKPAMLHYRLVCDTERYHLLEVRLFTGRHHQIRCQLAHMGCHIKGDLKYGAPRSNQDGSICLHSRRVEFIHPVSGLHIDVTAPLPPVWKGVPENPPQGL